MNEQLRSAMANMPSEKRAQLEARLAAQRAGRSGTIPRRTDLSNHPLSDGQRRLLDLTRIVPDPAVYHLQRVYRITGPLDSGLLDRALTTIVNRHETLRARFGPAGPQTSPTQTSPIQTIGPERTTVLSVHDETTAPDDEGLDGAMARVAAIGSDPFDLSRDGLFRADLIALGPHDHVLAITAHHLGCDGWSMGIIERELGLLYRHTDGAEPLSPPAIQTSDVTAWEQADRARHDAQLDHWRASLEGAEPLVLPGRGRPGSDGARAGHQRIVVAAEVVADVVELGRQRRTTPQVILLAAWCSVLHRLTAQEDLLICTPSAGRTHPSTHDLVGYFNNVVPLRCDLSGQPTFGRLLERLRPVVIDAVDNDRPAFQAIAGLPPVASMPLTRCLLVVQDDEEPAPALDGLSVDRLEIEGEVADFDLELYARRVDDEIHLVVRHRHRVLAPSEVSALGACFLALLEAGVADPDRGIDELPLPADAPAVTRAAPVRPAGTAPRSPLEAELRQIWDQVLDAGPIGVDDDFFDLGGHSLVAAQLMHEIERRIVGQPLPLAALFAAPTISEQAALIEHGGWSRSWASLVPIQPAGRRPPLFFVHAHGGNVIGYRALADHLGPDQPFYGLQSPHADTGRQPVRLEAIAANYIDELRTVAPQGPYLVGGWCLGGDIAFEMAQQLRRSGHDVALVVMVDNPRPPVGAGAGSMGALRRAGNRMVSRVVMEWVNLRQAGRRERIGYLRHRATRAVERTTVAVESILHRLPIDLPRSRAFQAELVARHHEKAYQDYGPQPYEGRVAIVRARHQPVGRGEDPTLGWDAYLAGERDLIEAPGHRIGLLAEPRVGAVSELMAEALARALAAGTTPPQDSPP